LLRPLTRRGRKQADASAAWLRARLPAGFRVVCSPATRTRETAASLTGTPEVLQVLAPGADPHEVLAAIGWPDAEGDVVVVGHQPWLGQVAHLALTGEPRDWSVRKSGIWWLHARTRDRAEQAVLRAVIDPDLL
jgi:phosphohistidine phosphatase